MPRSQQTFQFHFCSAPNTDREELIFFLNNKLKSPPSLQNFNESLQTLRSLHANEFLTKEQVRHLYTQCISYFASVPTNTPEFQDSYLTTVSDEMTGLSQSIVESLEPTMVTNSLDIWSNFDPKFSKPYWHFVEFLLTRSKFMNLFEGDQIVKLLDSYYQVQERYEADKFAYIFDKCDEYICKNRDLKFSDKSSARVLYLYAKSNLGSDNLFQNLFERFIIGRPYMSIENVITCGWSIVSYNLKKRNKSLVVYNQETYQKVLESINQLNSYKLKQFLWAYHKEQELFG